MVTSAMIRQVMLNLHGEGIYPSAQKVAKLLGDPHVIRGREGPKIWRAILEEIGYHEKYLG